MIDLGTVKLGTFEPLVGDAFSLATDIGPIDLVLHKASQRGQGIRDGGNFSLIFTGNEDQQFEQQLCPLSHPDLGGLTLLLVPIGPVENGMGYQAVFA